MAAVTWTLTDGLAPIELEVTGAAATTATDAPTAGEGIGLQGLVSLEVELSADDTRTLSGTGTLRCWRKIGASWSRRASWDLSVASEWTSAVRRVSFTGGSACIGIPVAETDGRICWVPDTIAVSAGAVTIRIRGTPGRP